jgi:outer membrane protein assembly factor BamB
VLHKELVIVNASSESRTVQALDRKTGRMVWKLVDEQRLDLAYNTPVLTKLPTGRVELVLSVPNVVWGLDPDTGKGLWWARTATGGNICPTVVADGDRVYAMGGFPNTGTVAVRAGGQGDVTNTHTLWSSRYTSYVPSCVVAGGKLFWLNDKGMAYGLDGANGNLLFEQRMNLAATGGGSLVYASALLAGDRVYAVTRKEGTVVMSAGQRFKLLAQNRFASDSSQFNGSPAAADGQLFLRSDRFMYCVSGT